MHIQQLEFGKNEEENKWPPGLGHFSKQAFFVQCTDFYKSECNMYCLDCMNGALYSACLACHKEHKAIQVNFSFPSFFYTFSDPEKMGFQGVELQGASKHFMAFGGGMRFCVGTDFTKVQMAMFIHSLVTKYRWRPIKGGNILRTPGLQFPNGFHVQIMEKDQRKQQEPEYTITTKTPQERLIYGRNLGLTFSRNTRQ
ncbi:Cytochrome P450 87A3 [Glycine soja]|uniref:Cytochrome P450 87A3 n=2 Tax=Glycine soja TaxID=3848 RepID=A0A445I4C1_GLYSO|nr:Cytochrome P450 87A3 [Glycine soja]